MILSNNEIFSDAQAITATAGSTNVIDLGAPGTPLGAPAALVADLGKSGKIPLDVRVTVAFATLTSLTVSVETDSDPAFGTAVTVAQGPAVPVATLVAGYQFPFPARVLEGVNNRYMRLKYTVGGSNATAGKITAAIVADRQTQ